MVRPAWSAEERHRRSEAAKLVWANRRAKKQGYQESPIVAVSTQYVPPEEKPMPVVVEPLPVMPLDRWQTLPLEEAHRELAELEAELRHAKNVVGVRSIRAPKVFTCWVAANYKEHQDLPGIHTAYRKCPRKLPDGPACKYIDNNNINPDTGLVDPIVCCGSTCYAIYQTYLQRLKMAKMAAKRVREQL